MQTLEALNYIEVDTGRFISPAVILVQDSKIAAINPDQLPANIIAVKGNPLKNIRLMENVAFVMKGGEIIKWD